MVRKDTRTDEYKDEEVDGGSIEVNVCWLEEQTDRLIDKQTDGRDHEGIDGGTKKEEKGERLCSEILCGMERGRGGRCLDH